MKLKLIIVVTLTFLFCFQNVYAQNKKITPGILISSPGSKINFHLDINSGTISYSIDFNKIPVIESSLLDLIVNGLQLAESSESGSISSYCINETYPYRGVHSISTNKCNGAKIHINAKQNFVIDVRVFNDCVASRYIIKNKDSGTIEKDNSEFVISAVSTTWSQPNIKYYEGKYGKMMTEDFKGGNVEEPPVSIQLHWLGLEKIQFENLLQKI